MTSQKTSEVIDLTDNPTNAIVTNDDRRKNEAIVRFYKTALDQAIPLIDPQFLNVFSELVPKRPTPDASLSDKLAYYVAALDQAGKFLPQGQRYTDIFRADEETKEGWRKGAAVMVRVYFGPSTKSSAIFFPLWMEPLLSEVGISLLAHESTGVSRSDHTLLLHV